MVLTIRRRAKGSLVSASPGFAHSKDEELDNKAFDGSFELGRMGARAREK